MIGDEMLAQEQASWDAFVQAVEALPEDRRDVEGVVPGWSAKDWRGTTATGPGTSRTSSRRSPQVNLGCRTRTGRAQRAGDRGRPSDVVGREIWSRSGENRTRARAALGSLPELTDTAVEEFEGETYEHYEEHTAEVAAFAPAEA